MSHFWDHFIVKNNKKKRPKEKTYKKKYPTTTIFGTISQTKMHQNAPTIHQNTLLKREILLEPTFWAIFCHFWGHCIVKTQQTTHKRENL